MRRQILLASVGAIAIAGSAFAADLPSRAPPPVYLPPPPIFTWTGVFGGQVGYAWGTGANRFDGFIDDAFVDTSLGGSPNGVIRAAMSVLTIKSPAGIGFRRQA